MTQMHHTDVVTLSAGWQAGIRYCIESAMSAHDRLGFVASGSRRDDDYPAQPRRDHAAVLHVRNDSEPAAVHRAS